MAEADLVVVGAGPAGGAAAIRAAQAGLRAIVLDAAAAPRERPGETLHPGVEPLFERLGVAAAVHEAGFVRHTGLSVRWEAARTFVPYGADAAGPWRGFQAWRSTLDAILLERARALGVEVRRGARVDGVVVDRDRVGGVRLRGGETVRARCVVDGAGGRHVLARALGLSRERFTPRLVAHYGYATDVVDETASLEADARGWTFRAQVRPGLWQWTRLPFSGVRLDVDPRAIGRPTTRPRAQDVSWRWVPACAGPGWFLAGDAAVVLDPASSHGVLRALMSGMLAGDLAATTASGAAPATSAIASYRRWLGDWVAHDVAELRALYSRLSQPPGWASSLTPAPPAAGSRCRA
jgi:flavin-dependent dehydrogenase